jgi:predicted nucleotidyltransferase
VVHKENCGLKAWQPGYNSAVSVVSDKYLEEIVNRLTHEWPVERIILFGSRARGDNRPDSDYDLLVLISDAQYFQGISVEMRGSIDRIPVSKDMIVARTSSHERLESVCGTVNFEAAHEGVTLYGS